MLGNFRNHWRLTVVLLLVPTLLIGCKRVSSRPILVQAKIVDAKESAGNTVAKYSSGLYQEFHDVKFEILSPPEYEGKWLIAQIEFRAAAGNEDRFLGIGNKVEFMVNPQLFNKKTPAPMSEIINYEFIYD